MCSVSDGWVQQSDRWSHTAIRTSTSYAAARAFFKNVLLYLVNSRFSNVNYLKTLTKRALLLFVLSKINNVRTWRAEIVKDRFRERQTSFQTLNWLSYKPDEDRWLEQFLSSVQDLCWKRMDLWLETCGTLYRGIEKKIIIILAYSKGSAIGKRKE